MKMRGYYLISTEHFTDRIWFRDDDDFKTAMNLIAVASFLTSAVVLDFVLMSNHLHFVLSGTEEQICRFLSKFKRLYSMYLFNYRGTSKMLKRNNVDIRPVYLEDESLKRAIAYVQMNPVAANICVYPHQYRWGCGDVFFNQHTKEGTPIDSFSKNSREKLLHSRVELPSSFIVTSDNYISPDSFVAKKLVENIFKTPKSFQFFLRQSSKARNRLEKDPMPSFRDQTINMCITDLCLTMFKTETIAELNKANTAELLKQLQYRFSSDLAQISRVTGIPYPEVTKLLEDFR